MKTPENRNADGTIQLFKNPYMEALTHVHPAVPAIVWIPIIAFLVWRSLEVHGLATSLILGIMFCGFFTWTFTEYLLHRFVFHYEAKSEIGKKIVYLFHGIHHDAPQDFTRLVMPPAAAFIIGGILFTIFKIILGDVRVEPFFAGFLVGYLGYDYSHYYVHRFTPKSWFGKMIKQNHMVHHFVAQNTRMGVSSPIWDYVFHTFNASAENTSGHGRPVSK